MDLKLKDNVALITGSSLGIGLATAKACAAEGCCLVLSARSAEPLAAAEVALRAEGVAVASCVADVGQPDQAARLVEAATGRALPTAPMRIGAARSSAISFRPFG